MSKKVKLGIFDVDLKVRTLKKYDVTDDGAKIRVVSGGESHFMPAFDNYSFLEFPLPWWKGGGWERIYLVRKGAKNCIDFQADPVKVPAYDPKLVMNAAGNKILQNLGSDKQETPIIIYLILLAVVGVALKVFGVIA